MPAHLLRDLSDSSEEQITALARAGNADAFGELFERNHRRSTQLALSILSNPVIAEEVISQSFYKAYIHIDKLHGIHFRSWFNSIVVNECYQHLRNTARTRQVLLESEVEASDAALPATSLSENPEARVGSSELMALLAKDVGKLPPNLRMPLLLSLRQRSLAEIAQELGISVSCAKSRLFRARTHLKRRVARYLPLRRVVPSGHERNHLAQSC
jgi:RNA polymerase sigma factor (sigma-70 family)